MVDIGVHFCHRLFCLSQFPPDDEIEDTKNEKWTKRCHSDPCPCAVEDYVISTEPKLGRSHICDLMISTFTTGEVHTIADRLSFKEFSDIKESRNENTWKNIHHGSCHLRRCQPCSWLCDSNIPLTSYRYNEVDRNAKTESEKESIG